MGENAQSIVGARQDLVTGLVLFEHDGPTLPAGTVDDNMVISRLKSSNSRTHAITLRHMAGSLTVSDPEALVSLVTKSIGRSRSYGAGLLLTRPSVDA